MIYATARNTGQRAAEQALKEIAEDESQLTGITLTAKEKTCFNPGSPWTPMSAIRTRLLRPFTKSSKDLMSNGISGRQAVESIAGRTGLSV
ncbi:MAG: hypothetical protein Ct9H300mP8_09730 [Gammaproteobacteria bacterium]|nr:MAG: hypothetical protein Ct9H300mP8_09730 [Gammaproteobacteria bacterium]